MTLADGWYQNAEWACDHENGLEAHREPSTTAVHVRVERRNGVGAWHSCASVGNDEGCVAYCREASVVTYDWFLRPESLESIAIVTRVQRAGPWEGEEDRDQIPDASEVGGRIDLSVADSSVVVVGCGVRLDLDLTTP